MKLNQHKNYVIIANLKSETTGKLIKRIPGLRLLKSFTTLLLWERMLNCSASLAMSTSILKALPGKLDIKRHSPSILYFADNSELSVLKLWSFTIRALSQEKTYGLWPGKDHKKKKKNHNNYHVSPLYGPRCEKTCLRKFVNNTGADQTAHRRSLISTFVIRFLERSVCKLPTSEI